MAYYVNGSVRHRFQYRDGAKTGTNLEFHPNGTIKTKEQVSLSGIDVTEEGFDDMGKAVYEKHFRKLRPHGTWTFFASNGKSPAIRENYLNGKLEGIRTIYFENGEIKTEETYQFNLITGTVKNYFKNGKIESVTEYRASRPHGLFTSYHANGEVKEQGEYVAGKKHKEWKEFDENGNVVKTYVFKAGILVEEK